MQDVEAVEGGRDAKPEQKEKPDHAPRAVRRLVARSHREREDQQREGEFLMLNPLLLNELH